ncbi:TPA: hypothetical protein JLL51_004463 [Escherichia coli]|nr:hypothetical protein [Escherichia coli]
MENNFRICGMIFHDHGFPNIHAIAVGQWRVADDDDWGWQYDDGYYDPYVAALNEKYEPICPNGKPLDQYDEDEEENGRIQEQMEAYVGKRFDERMRLTFGEDLKCFLSIKHKRGDQLLAIVGREVVPVDYDQFERISKLYAHLGEIPFLEDGYNGEFVRF